MLTELLDDEVFFQINKKKYVLDKNNQKIPFTGMYDGAEYIYKYSKLSKINENIIQIHNIGYFFNFSNYKLTDTEIKECNTNGLKIYITEELFYLNGPDDIPNIVFSQESLYKDEWHKWINWFNTHEFKIKSLELLSCKHFIDNNNLKNVTICISSDTKNFDIVETYGCNIVRDDVHLEAVKTILKQTQLPMPNSKSIIKKFWCGNWRYEPHRHILAAYLTNFDTNLSWHFNSDITNLNRQLHFDIHSWKEKYPTYYKKLMAGISNLEQNYYRIDYGKFKVNLAGNFLDIAIRPDENNNHPDWEYQVYPILYKDTFCSIVNLGSFGNIFATYDEKPLNSIKNWKPFVLVGPAGSLELMRNDGFKTFGDFWDESYDQETDPEKRLIKIFDVIEYIDKFSIEELQNMYKDMSSILKHNYKLLS